MRKLFVVFFLLSLCGHVYAQNLFEVANQEESSKPDFDGYIRGIAFGLGTKYFVSQAYSEIGVQSQYSKGKSMFYADLRFRDMFHFGIRNTEMEIKELYVAYVSEKIDVSLGNQIVVWGRTDGFNPTNVITPKNYFFFSPNMDDQNLSNFMIRSKIRLNSAIQLDLIGIPVYKPSVYEYQLFDFQEKVEFYGIEKPVNSFENASFAARLNVELPSLGFSFSYSNGYHPDYGIELESFRFEHEGEIFMDYLPKPFMHNTIGADFDYMVGEFILRGEAAYQHTHHYEDITSEPNPEMAYVAGLEFNVFGFTAITQYIGKYVVDYNNLEEPILLDYGNFDEYQAYIVKKMNYETEQFNRKIFYQEEELNHAFVFSLNRRFLYELLDSDFSFYYNLTLESYFFRANIQWQIYDALSATIGGNYMYGPPGTIFKLSNPVLNGVYLSLQINI